MILIKMEIGYNGESFDDFSQKNSLAKLSKGSDAKAIGTVKCQPAAVKNCRGNSVIF